MSAPTAAKMSWTWRQTATASPGLLPLTPSCQANQFAVHLPVEAEEEGVPPIARFFGPFADVGVVAAFEGVGELEFGLVELRRGRLRGPAEHRDRAVGADLVHRTLRELVVVAGAPVAVREGGGEVDHRSALAGHALELGDGAHVPGGLVAGQLAADPGAPVDRAGGAGGNGFAAATGARPPCLAAPLARAQVAALGAGAAAPAGDRSRLRDLSEPAGGLAPLLCLGGADIDRAEGCDQGDQGKCGEEGAGDG